MKTFVRAAFALLLAGYTAMLVSGNQQAVGVNLVLAELAEVPLWLIILGSVLLGLVTTALVLSIPLLRMRLRLRRQAKQIGELEQEVHGLRTLPLGGKEPQAAAAGSALEP